MTEAEQEFGRLFGLDMDSIRVKGDDSAVFLETNKGHFKVQVVQVGESGLLDVGAYDAWPDRIYVAARDIGFKKWKLTWQWGKRLAPLRMTSQAEMRPIEELLVRHVFTNKEKS